MARSLNTILTSMKSFISGLYPKANVDEGTLLHDVVMQSPAVEIAKISTEIENVGLDQSYLTASTEGLAVLANVENLERKEARPAVGYVTFFSRSAPASDIEIPIGTVVSTQTSNSNPGIEFKTTQSVTMYEVYANNYFNVSTNVYEIKVAIEAVTGGNSGVVGAGNIIIMATAISGVDGCYNSLATYGGTERESNTSLQSRIALAKSGSALGTEDGLLAEVLSNDAVEGAVVRAHGTSDREGVGVVDIYVKGTKITERIEAFSHVTADIPNLILGSQPVESITAVTSSGDGEIAAASWELAVDDSTVAGSIYAEDTIEWAAPLAQATYGTIYVQYVYDSLVEELQNTFAKTNKNITNMDLLIKRASKIAVDVSGTIKLLTNFTASEVKSNIESALTVFFDDLVIGEEVQQSDVVGVIIGVPGVDDLTLPLDLFQSSDGSVTQNSGGNLEIPLNTYASIGDVIITVVV